MIKDSVQQKPFFVLSLPAHHIVLCKLGQVLPKVLNIILGLQNNVQHTDHHFKSSSW